MKRALQIILVLAGLGTLFSGTLTYNELFGAAALKCPAPGAPGTILGYPACVYGFFMFLAITGVAGAGLFVRESPAPVGANTTRAIDRTHAVRGGSS
ncbi:MAG TPA: hypothetical protein VGU74_08300 [Gemmatimonadales bacterium]|nr:hypothetical protein [Gemmatimonadales bacterium]